MKEENTDVLNEKVPVSSKAWVSIADAMCAILNTLITGGTMTYIFTTYWGMESKYSAAVWLIFGIWNAFNDPLFGYISDRTKSKLGKRIPYIRYGAIFYSIIFIFVWFRWPIGESQISMFIQMLVSLFLFDTLYTAIATSIYVLPYTMAISNKARSGIMIWKICFSLLAMAFPLVVTPLILPKPGESSFKFQMIMVAIGVVGFVIIFASTFFYKEKVQTASDNNFNIFKSVASCFKNRSFIVFEVLSFSIIFIQTNLMMGVNYYFPEFGTNLMAPSYAALGIGAVLGMVVWLRKMKDWGVRNCILIMSILFAFGAGAMVFFGKYLPVSIVGFFLAGLGFSGGFYLVPIMNGDVIDYDEHLTGLRREGMYAGVNSLITKPAASLSNAAFVAIINYFGYNADSIGAQTEAAKGGILVAWMAIPAVLLIITAISLKWYPLNGKKWDEIKLQLEHKHLD